MTTKEKREILIEILVSTSIIFIISLLIMHIDWNEKHFEIFLISYKSSIYSTIIKIEGILIASILTVAALRINNIDSIINKHIGLINSIFDIKKHETYSITLKGIEKAYEAFKKTIDNSNAKDINDEFYIINAGNILKQLRKLFDYRKHNTSWIFYPVIYNLIIIVFCIFLMVFSSKIQENEFIIFGICFITMMVLWSIIISYLIIKELFSNPFDKEE